MKENLKESYCAIINLCRGAVFFFLAFSDVYKSHVTWRNQQRYIETKNHKDKQIKR